jgi:hypothetical protein
VRPLLPMAALAAAALACGEAPRQPLEPADPVAPAFERATVDRGPLQWLFYSIDPTAGYSLQIGATTEELAQFCSSGDFSSFATTWKDLSVGLPTGGARYLDLGEMPVVVYQGIVFDPCDPSVTVYATGTMKVIVNEHVPGENGGAYMIGLRGSGTVTTTGGEQFRLHLAATVVLMPNGGFHDPGAKITLTPLN